LRKERGHLKFCNSTKCTFHKHIMAS
jgi:hypothetical protein